MIDLALMLLLSGSSSVRAENGPVSNLEAARDLLMARNFVALTALVEAKQAAAKDSLTRDRLDWTLNAFELPYPAIPGLIDEWVQAAPASWAPLMARATSRRYQSGLARGQKWASQTTEQQVRRMAELDTAVVADCRAVLSRNPGVCACHKLLAITAKSSAPAGALMEQAFKACPLDQGLNIEYVFGLTPRWGGSYKEMREAIEKARRRGLPPQDIRGLEGYIAIDQATLKELGGDSPGALNILSGAVKAGATPQLLQERARIQRSLEADPAGTLAEADGALALSAGGLAFSSRRLGRLLLDRVWALAKLRRMAEAKEDVDLAIRLRPTDEEAISWAKYLRVPVDATLGRAEQPVP